MGVQRLVFKTDTESYELHYVSQVEGFGIPPVELAMRPRGWRKDGDAVQYVRFGARPFTIVFDLKQATYAQVAAEHRNLMRFFADKTARTLEYTRYDGTVVYLYPVYLADVSEPTLDEVSTINDTMQFIAGECYFKRAIAPVSATLEEAVLQWRDDIGLQVVDAEGGIQFSIAEETLYITNNGDIEADTLIRFVGSAINPVITNNTTGQSIEVTQTLGATDTLEINSATGRVEIVDALGNRSNAFNYITDTSEFITLARGVNEIEYGSSGGNGYVEVGGTEYYDTAV